MIPLYDKNKSLSPPFITITIIVTNVLIHLYGVSLGNIAYGEFIGNYSFIPGRFSYYLIHNPLLIVSHPTYITNIFLHGSWFHLISNMWILWIFGDNVEDKLGHFKYLLFYIIGGIIANLTQLLFSFNSNIPTIGASGAIASVMGAYMIFFPLAKVKTLIPIIIIPLFIDIPAFIFLIIWFILQLLYGTSSLNMGNSSGIAWWSHIGGFIFGIIYSINKKDEKK
jgi:membrane associated rhomboid family serine protease